MHIRGWFVDGTGRHWRKPLFAWEKDMLHECILSLDNVSLQYNIIARWSWRIDLNEEYTVKGAYELLSQREGSVWVVCKILILFRIIKL